MRKYIAQFVGSHPTTQVIMHISRTPNLAYLGVCRKLKEVLAELSEEHVEVIELMKSVPEELQYTQFEHDAYAVLYGSADLKPHITVRSLPQGS
ncbi:hypothetical protein MKK63_11445 [Methylobacterium sp. J-088]|uniref:hypothetical protein n=1 Tax=Methylobacterium sp. J-088 TaxID=2836664 RepID=UPI001FB94801|nr:hypothetical protein [Methylobacterium sp. J-088]MCJ2063323.1 hypothetical protein [Methylobacterium sp. J-088]